MSIRGKIKALRIYTKKALHGLPEITITDLFKRIPQVMDPILDSICMPPHYSVTDHDDYTPLMVIARGMEARLIVELGTAHGNTTANLCRHLPDAKILTVNAPLNLMTGVGTTFSLTEDEIGKVYRAHGFGGRVQQVFANTLDLDLARHIEPSSADIAIVDACHDTEYVVNDFHKVRGFVRPGGIVLLHDTHPSMKGHVATSYIACMDLRKTGFDMRWLKDTWWGVWTPDWSRFPLA